MSSSTNFYLALDIETSGQDMVRNFIVSIGACVIDVEHMQQLDSDEFLIYLIPPPGTCWEPNCVKNFWNSPKKAINGRTQFELLQRAQDEHGAYEPRQALTLFLEFVKRMAHKYPNLVVLTDTAGFDIEWLDYSIQRYTHYPRKFDSLAYCTGEYRSIWNVTAFYRGIARMTPHDALSDARNAEQCALEALGEDAFPDFGIEHDHNPLHDAKLMGLRAAYISKLLQR